ncbi:transporter substrate-binding domain-containing protein [Tissierella creatinini]|nr:transporter substrate-binding domain-containing protein [Tissierella creatinini]TJX65590.1 transporter substrate-binding domain-containing protein [Soehngenia saccharolytica]
MIKKILVILMVASMMISLGACANSGNTTKETETPAVEEPKTEELPAESGKIAEIKEKGKIVLGTAAGYPPFEFHKIIDGKDQIVGVDIEIAKRIAQELGVDLEIVDMKFEGVIPALVTDDIDMIIAGMVATEERTKVVDFSVPYYQAKHKLVVKIDDKDKYKTFEDVDVAGLKIGVQKATTQEALANEMFKNAEVVAISKLPDVVLELKNGKINATIIAEPVANAYVKQNQDLYVAEADLGQEPGINIAVNKGNQDLVDFINVIVEDMKSKGEVLQLLDEATALSEQ